MSRLLQESQPISCVKASKKYCDNLAHKISQRIMKLQNFGSSPSVSFDGDSLITVNIHQPFFSDWRDLVIVLKIDLKGRTIKMKAFFCKNLVITFTGSQNLSMASLGRNLLKLNSYRNNKNPIIVIQKILGQISITCNQNLTQKFFGPNQMIDFLKQKINCVVCHVKPRAKTLFKYLNLLPCSYDRIDHRNRQNSEVQEQSLLCKIAQYINMSIIPNIDQRISVSNQTQTQRPEYSICKNIRRSQHSWKTQKSYKLFGYVSQTSMKPKTYTISSSEENIFESRFQKPFARSNKAGQNKFIFNYIKIPDELIENLRLKNKKKPMVTKGGRCKLFFLQSLKFHYIDTVQAIAENQTTLPDGQDWTAPKGQLQKNICIKQPHQNQESRLRVDHQIQIVKLFKGASTSYMIKYYMTTQQNFQYKGRLFFDFIGDPTLQKFLGSRGQTLSMCSRILLVINIAQTLRFLNQYHIAHLDLNPANIFILKDLRVKIFDFSESYHKEVCKGEYKYKPGYTLPYSCPEVFFQMQKYEYTIRNDIYSLGMIMLRLFFRTQYMNFSKVIKYYKVKKYFKHFFFNIQGLESYANYKILNNLANLILKCLHPDLQKRPYPTWVIVILAEIAKLLQ